MYIGLKTFEIWHIEGKFSPAQIFDAILSICLTTDILVLGSYNPSPKPYEFLLKNSVDQNNKPYSDSFDFNRDEYPLGRGYNLPVNPSLFSGLKELSESQQGSVDKALFFDHLLVYRPGVPMVPLINFHDAFSGGELYLSGLYDLSDLQTFLSVLKSSAKLEDNGEFLVSPER